MNEQHEEQQVRELRQAFKLGTWEVYPDRNLILSPGKEVRLEPKVMEVLLFLAARQGQVVSRDELIESVWNTVVSDEVLSRAISLLRTCLDDNSKAPAFIQTVPKKGYRLICEVDHLEEQPPVIIDQPVYKHFRTLMVAASSVVAVFLAIVFTLFRNDNSSDISLAEWLSIIDMQQGSQESLSIAVLPFDNLSDSAANNYLSEGLTDEVTMFLSKVNGLRVVARTSSYSQKKRLNDIPTIGKLLNVSAILEGSVTKTGDSLKVNAQLSQVKNGYLIWSESYQGSVDKVFDIQRNLSRDVVRALQNNEVNSVLSEPSVLSAKPDEKAYKKYLSGRFLAKLRGEKPLRESILHFRAALELAPGFTKAQLGLVSSMALLPFYSAEPMDELFNQALTVIDTVVPSDDWERGEVEAIKAHISWHRWDWVAAEHHFRKAIELAPDNANTYIWYSQYLSSVGKVGDAVTAAERAKELDAVSPVVNDRLGIAYLWQGDDIRAAEQFAIGSQLGFSNRINPGYIIFLLRQQRYNEFKSVMEALHPESATRPDWLIENGHLVFLPENRTLALSLATQARNENRLIMPLLQFGLWILIGGIDQAYEQFDTFSVDEQQKYTLLEFVFTQEATEFRDDPRFQYLLKQTGIKAYWDEFGAP